MLGKPSTVRLVLALFLTAVTIVAYRGAWHGGFIWDDDYYVTKNPLLTAADGLKRIWFSFDAPSQYFPLSYTLLRLERSWWGLNPTGYHSVNLLLHVTNALLVWRLLARLRIPGALLAASIFALHPVQVESVAWISELKNLLMAFFFLLTLLAWVEFMDDRQRRRWLYYGAALLAYFLALTAKTTACTLPVALLLLLCYQEKRITPRRIWQILPFVLLGVGMGLLTIWWERFHQGTRGEFFALGPIERVLVASHALWFYLGKLFWPHQLTFIYPQWRIVPNEPSAYGWIVATIAAAAVLVAIRKKTGRSVGIAAFFFVGTLGPILGFIMLYTFRYTYVADHYQYLACIGPIALVAATLARLSTRNVQYRISFYAIAAAILASMALITWRQAATYRDIETLWRTTLARNPACWMAYNNLGIELARQGDFAQAISQYNKSLELYPAYAEAHYNLATAFLEQGNNSRALTEASLAVQMTPNDPDAHVALGNALLTNGDIDQSIVHYERALRLRPEDASAFYNLGNALQQKAENSLAIEAYGKALEINPDMVEAHLNLGNVFAQRGAERSAIDQYERALAISPHSAMALNNLAWTLVTASDKSLRNASRALQLAHQADIIAGGTDPHVLNTLGASYAEAGQFERATEIERRALQLAENQNDEALTAEIGRVIQLYSGRSPYGRP